MAVHSALSTAKASPDSKSVYELAEQLIRAGLPLSYICPSLDLGCLSPSIKDFNHSADPGNKSNITGLKQLQCKLSDLLGMSSSWTPHWIPDHLVRI
jgi:hypothetical protein